MNYRQIIQLRVKVLLTNKLRNLAKNVNTVNGMRNFIKTVTVQFIDFSRELVITKTYMKNCRSAEHNSIPGLSSN